jgi:two-component system, LuxR family, response regulator FixJ
MTVGGGAHARRVTGASVAVHVIDDEEEVCWGIATLLMSVSLDVTTHVSGLAFLNALAALPEDRIGCVLTDIQMPGLNGLKLLGQLRAQGFQRPIIVMTAHGDVLTAVRAMKAGAFDFVEKPFDDDALLAIIWAALGVPRAGGPSGAGAPTGQGGGTDPRVAEAVSRVAALSPREREVLGMAMDGKASKIIAYELGISPRTVEVHRTRMMTRLGVGSLAEAARLAVWAELAGFEMEPTHT